ncbi:MAG: DegT/DnrJ/EryC1/StrS family aminotransferase [Geobacter sp.]|nr:MAG: DegT/DnrJ/EryC1/StrS family aminotransferase [Geobacter sp.]
MIPVSEPLLTSEDLQRVNDAVASGWISSAGEYLERFEKSWAAYCGMPHGIAVSNGSVALDLAVALLDLEPGDEVIMPAFTIISPAQSVVRAGGIPVLVDSEPRTWQMDVRQVEAKITPRTKAIIAVHIYGHPADMDPLLDVARRHGLTVIEDAAEVHGALYRGRPCGGLADISTFSFYANKLVTTGEGGMVLARTPELAERARSLRNLCFQKKQRFLHEELGFNFRLTNPQAAMGLGQVERIEAIVQRKRDIASGYLRLLRDLPGIELPVEEPWARNVYWVFGLVLKEATGLSAARLAERLHGAGIETRPFFLGMHEQPVFHKMGLFRLESHPVAERLARQGLYIPSGLSITDAEMETVAGAVRSALA